MSTYLTYTLTDIPRGRATCAYGPHYLTYILLTTLTWLPEISHVSLFKAVHVVHNTMYFLYVKDMCD